MTKGESGQAVVIVALLMVVVFGLAAVGVDIGAEVARGVKLQGAADAAALAGVTALAQNGDVTAAVDAYLQANGIPLSAVASINNDPDNQTVTVALAEPNPFYFAPVLGFTTVTVKRSATARLNAPQVFNYALFSNEDLNLSQNKINVNGNAHSNSNVNISTNNGYIQTTTEASGTINLSDINFQTTPVPNAPVISMPDFSSQLLAQAQEAGQVYNGDYNIDDNNSTINGTIYVYGNVNISTNNIKGNGSIFATGDISISTNNASFGAGYIGYYSQQNINISTNNLTGNGVLYAPNGAINISANNIHIADGAIIGNSINLSTNTLEVDSSDLNSYILPRMAYLSN
ncbi:MAG: pilus assembly protein TadG-related protein [Peptococcaceae bacterium]|jgi:hypothetical protein|nr:pilus assembly protein TadG-related protein [Peptococcaceae bacterium]